MVALSAPADPRAAWRLPAPGTMPAQARLEDLVTRVLAPNPSGLTLDGTNTYLVGAPGTGEVALVDPGPTDVGHLDRVEQALRDLDATCRWVLVTHHHADHAEAAIPWARRFGARVVAASAPVGGAGGLLVVPGEWVALAGTEIEVVPTPGHTGDHLSFRLDSGAVLTGDHVLGRGTSLVAHPQGDLAAYLESLRRVRDLGPSVLYPGHGPELAQDPTAVIDFYLAHRQFREDQVLDLLRDAGGLRVADMVRVIYREVDRALWPAATQSTHAALDKLRAEGVVRLDLGQTWRPVPGAAVSAAT